MASTNVKPTIVSARVHDQSGSLPQSVCGRGAGTAHKANGCRAASDCGQSFADTSGPVAWKTLPSWAIIATEDVAAGTDIVRSMAERAGAKVTELRGSHAIMISQPQAVTDVILEAAKYVGLPTVQAV